MDIYYFSGTGNSLFVARELQKRLPEANLIPMARLLNRDVIKPDSDSVGFVFPVYFMTVPAVVKNFIKKLDLTSARYIFAVATRGGTPTRAFTDIDNVLKKKGRSLDACFILNMAYNDPKFHYETPSNKEIARLEAVVRKRLGTISKVILKKEYNRETDTTVVTFVSPITLMLIPVLTGISEITKMENSYYTGEGCTGCGTCERVCLSGKIKLVDKKPVWLKNVRCFNCEACIDYCPQAAIQIKDSPFIKFNTLTNGRYTHPYATIEEIEAEKENRR